MTTRGKVKGRILFRVDAGGGYAVAKLLTFTVTSIMRKPVRVKYRPRRFESDRAKARRKASPKTVYVRAWIDNASREGSFLLEDWPGDYSATKRAAWKRAIPLIESEIKRIVDTAEDAKGDPAHEAENVASLRLLRRSLTKATKLAKA